MLTKERVWLVVVLGLSFVLMGGLVLQAAEQGKTLAGKLTPNEVFEYKSFPAYQESPALSKLVAQGVLPPIKERLPETPKVLKKTIMVDGPGVYGGVWRGTFAVPPEGWNWAAGQTQGWFGINQIIQEALVCTGPEWMLKNPEPLPNLAKSWEWSADGKTLTMHLVKGIKWSDGKPFTADDVLFTYYDNILDPHVPSWKGAGDWTFGGQVTKLEKVDDYTIKWHFGIAYPMSVFFNMDWLDFSVAPAHIYKQYHPRYNSNMTYEDYINATPPEKLPPVVLGAWVPVAYKPGQLMVFVRNPFYWKVDEEGKQLPYLDEVWFMEAKSGEARTLNLIAGKGDRTNLENPQMFSLALKAAQKPGAKFELRWEGNFYIGYELELNMSRYAGVKSDRDKAIRDLFRNKAFREAISRSIDREGVRQAAFPGPFTKAWYGIYPSGAPGYKEEDVVKYPYDPNKAKELLASLGFKDTDGDGILNWPKDSPMKGENLVLGAIAHEDEAACVKLGEALVPLFRAVGIDLRLKVLKAPAAVTKEESSEFDIAIERIDHRSTPFAVTGTEGVAPIDAHSPIWHVAGPGMKRDLLPFERIIARLKESTATMISPAERNETFGLIQHLATLNLYTIPVYEARRALGIAKRFKNIPADAPVHVYQWFPKSNPLHMVWVPKSEQITPKYENLIPTVLTPFK